MKSKLSSFALAALALFSHPSNSNRLFLVDAAISIQTEVQCLLEEPTICIGQQTELGPTPAIDCSDLSDPTSCKTIYIGGYTYQYTFVQGLEEGNTDVEAIEKAKTGTTVTVYIDNDESTCEVAIGIRSCLKCSTDGCTSSGFPNAVKYDCSNLKNGRSNMDTCAPLEPFLNPFELEKGPAIVNDAKPVAEAPAVVTNTKPVAEAPAVVTDTKPVAEAPSPNVFDHNEHDVEEGPSSGANIRKKVRTVAEYSEDGQVPLGFVALGMLIFVLIVGFLSK